MSPRVFLPVVLRLALVGAGPFVVLWYFTGPLIAAAAALVLLVIDVWRISRTIQSGADDNVTYTPVQIHSTSWVDSESVDALGHDLQALGFTPIADREFRVPILPDGVLRALTHRGHRMYGVIAQTRGPAGTSSPSVTVFSALTDGRTLTTTSAQPDPTMALGLESIDSWQIRPEATARMLVAEHVATREQLLIGRDAGIVGDGSFAAYAQAQSALFHRQAEQCRSVGVPAALRRLRRWEKHPTKSWVSGRFTVGAPFIAPPVDAATATSPRSVRSGSPQAQSPPRPSPVPPTPAPTVPPSPRVDLRPPRATSVP